MLLWYALAPVLLQNKININKIEKGDYYDSDEEAEKIHQRRELIRVPINKLKADKWFEDFSRFYLYK